MPFPHPLRFGVSRSQSGSQPTEGASSPAATFARVLGAHVGSPVELVVTSDYDTLTNRVLDGSLHLAWMPPIAHARAVHRGAVLAAVSERDGAITYRSALLVRTHSVYIGVGGLRGVKVAWSDPSSAGGHLFPRLHLLHAGLDPRRDLVEERFFGSTHAAIEAVVRGDADVCACYVRNASSEPQAALRDVERVYPGAHDALRVVGVTDPIPPDGVVLSSRLEPLLQAKLRDVLLGLHLHEDGRAALAALMQADRLRGVTNDVLRILARLRAHVHA
jgi:phosphonate transport system substrate-binding protein